MNAEEVRLPQEIVPKYFPRLRNKPFEVKSPRTTDYNCIGWAAGDNQNWWWPGGRYWPTGIRADDSIPAFVAAFAVLDNEMCDSFELETNFEKIALYVDEQQTRQPMGHQSPPRRSVRVPSGPAYGRVAQMIRRLLPLRADS